MRYAIIECRDGFAVVDSQHDVPCTVVEGKSFDDAKTLLAWFTLAAIANDVLDGITKVINDVWAIIEPYVNVRSDD